MLMVSVARAAGELWIQTVTSSGTRMEDMDSTPVPRLMGVNP